MSLLSLCRPVRAAFVLAVASVAAVAAAAPAAAVTEPPREALYCVYNPATYVGNTQVLPAGRYCVPGP
jgi:type IV secretory pathway VirB2 component (pilin)